MPKRVHVGYNEPTVNYIDVDNGIGQHVLRIYRSEDGRIHIRTYDERAASISHDEALELAAAIGKI